MKIAEIQSLFLNTVGAHLKQKGFKHTKTKGMYRIVKKQLLLHNLDLFLQI